MSREAVARVLGQALVDKNFADALTKNPTEAAHSLGVHLGPNETSALKSVQVSQLENVANLVRSKLGISELLDQTQQQQQARMD
jgi:hypothetical protein